jgi:hypothetical protein
MNIFFCLSESHHAVRHTVRISFHLVAWRRATRSNTKITVHVNRPLCIKQSLSDWSEVALSTRVARWFFKRLHGLGSEPEIFWFCLFSHSNKPSGAVVAHNGSRWFVFKPKIQIWVNLGGSCNGRCWYILWTLGPFYGLLLYFMDIWYSSWSFGIFFPRFGILYKEKSGNPDVNRAFSSRFQLVYLGWLPRQFTSISGYQSTWLHQPAFFSSS